MTYSEEEIQKYLSILQNFKDGLNIISQVKDENIPPKTPEHVSCENCGNTHFFKDVVSDIVRSVFILLVVFLSKKLLLKIVVVSDRNVFTRENIIIKIK